jgi:glutamate-1-semialdehyde 2,1-aminomutase
MFGTTFEGEYLLAEEVVKAVPCADLVRFCNSGTESIQTVLRLARAFTGRDKIVKFEGHFHGWADNMFISVKPQPPMGPPQRPWAKREVLGQPEDAAANIILLPWNNLEILETTLKQEGHQIAAVICEPVMFSNSGILPQPGFLEGLQEATARHGVILIFDEVVTGFRLALGGAQEYFGVNPDLCVFAKGFAAGLPMAGFGGRKEIMDLVAKNIMPAMGTYNGNPLCIVGALAALRELARDDGAVISRINQTGRKLKDGLNQLFKEMKQPLKTVGCDSIFCLISPDLELTNYRDTLALNQTTLTRFHKEMMNQGVWYMGRGNFMLSAAHTDEDVAETLSRARHILEKWS